MEEILASIKRVIAEDGRAGPRPARGGVSAEPESQESEEDVLELSDPVSEADGLASEDVTAATRQSLAVLAAMRQPESAAAAPASLPATADPTDAALGAAVREMLRPMLKEWLDERLPEMVEDMVAREIARITGKGL